MRRGLSAAAGRPARPTERRFSVFWPLVVFVSCAPAPARHLTETLVLAVLLAAPIDPSEPGRNRTQRHEGRAGHSEGL